jgi:hypothetical protein
MANALLQPATDHHVIASIVAVQTVFASRTLVMQDSVVLISPVALSQAVLLALTVFRVRSALLVLAVGETFVWNHVRTVYAGHCLVVTPQGGTQADLRLYETVLSTTQNFYRFYLFYITCGFIHTVFTLLLFKSCAVYSGHL